LERRRTIYAELSNHFGFLGNLSDLANEEIRNKAEQLLKKYQTDLEDALPEECVHLASFLKGNKNLLQEPVNGEMSDSESEASRLLKLLKTCNVESVFPNVEIILRIFLSMAVTNCSGERSFSALKRVKNYLRSTLHQGKLTALALLFIESDFMYTIEFDDVVQKFAESKARKMNLM
jgi:hypothetical protein